VADGFGLQLSVQGAGACKHQLAPHSSARLRGGIELHDAASHYHCAINGVCACGGAELCEPVMAWLLMCVFQVCDDSTREDVRRRIDSKVEEMCHRGHQCMVTRRDANKGFKVRPECVVLMHSSSGVRPPNVWMGPSMDMLYGQCDTC
jgi:hypothetical protein